MNVCKIIVSRRLYLHAVINAASTLRFTKASYSSQLLTLHRDMRVKLIPALQDNYMYLLIDEASKQCAVVDPVEPDKVQVAVKEEGCELTTVLTTHHHWDHAGGNEKLIKAVGPKEVIGGDSRIGALTKKVVDGDEFKIGSLHVKCLYTPCHTTGHICYYVTGPSMSEPAVFTGDTLFVGGCGRFFEGTPDMMYKALVETLSLLPGETKVYCGHEYTVTNLKFAATVEKDNPAVKSRLQLAEKQRSNGQPTIPSTIKDEISFNPFMRVREPSLQKYAGQTDPIKVMGVLRSKKDAFRP